MSPDGDDYNLARDVLGMELQALQAEGLLQATMSRASLAIVAATSQYTLPAGIIDVYVGNDGLVGQFLPTGTTFGMPVRVMTRHDYMAQVPDKTTTGHPSGVYIERFATVRLQFWPVPTTAGSFTYESERLIYDGDPGSVTLDVIRKWQKAICYGVAWQVAMAKSAPLDRVNALKETAESEKTTARAQDVEKGPAVFYVGSRYPY